MGSLQRVEEPALEPEESEQRLDEALERLGAGAGASALVCSDSGIHDRLEAATGTSHPASLAFALSRHAEVLHRFGDPDLAVAAADVALRTFLDRRDEVNRPENRAVYVPAAIRAAMISAEIHERFGRQELADSARELTHGAVVHLVDPPALLAGTTLAGALTRLPSSCDQRMVDVAAELVDAVTAPATECSLVTTSQRCISQDSATIADVFADLALTVADSDPAASLRLGLEAHVLYANQSAEPSPEKRYPIAHHGPQWAQVLRNSSQICARRDLRFLAIDLDAWVDGVLRALSPYLMTDTFTWSVAYDCLAWSVQLARTTGNQARVAATSEALRSLEHLHPKSA